ncbi:MAG: tetratricopeptide repeat protein [Gammaproteobacteria bacterium]|nr:tetratricopeptide repeat protein [Gammaproteobacteria bacterium]
MAQRPQKKAAQKKSPQKNVSKPKAKQEDSELDTFFDDFFENNQPQQYEESENSEQQRQWMSDQLMWETTLGMREDETINRVITPGDDAKAASHPQPATQKRVLSDRERQLLRTQVEESDAKPSPPQPTRQPTQKPVSRSQNPVSRSARPQPHAQTRAQNPAQSQNAQAPQNRAPQNRAPQKNVSQNPEVPARRKPTVSASRAPVRAVQPSPTSKPSAKQPTANAESRIRSQSGALPKPGDSATNSRSKLASGQQTATQTQPRSQPQARPSASVRMPHTQTQPVLRKSDVNPEEEIIFDTEDEAGLANYVQTVKNLAIAATIAIVSFISGYYIGGSDSDTTPVPVAQEEKPGELAKSDVSARTKAKQSVAEKPKPKKASVKSAPVKTTATREPSNPANNTLMTNDGTPAAVFEGKEIDLEWVDQSSTATETSFNNEAENTSETIPNTTDKLPGDFSDPYNAFTGNSTSGAAQEPGTAKFTSAPQNKDTVATLPSAPAQSSDTNASSISTESTIKDRELQSLLDQSLQAFQNKQWQSLIDLSNNILAVDPGIVTALTNRAAANTELGNFGAALADCNTAIKIEPANPLAINNRGYVYEKMGDFQNAVADYEKACGLGVKLSCQETKRLKSAANQ